MKILQSDSPLMEALTKVADLIIINFFTVLMCIPIVTAGAAFTAMHYVCLKIVRGEEVYVSKQYFRSFKENFVQSTIIWLIMILVVAIGALDFYLLGDVASQSSKYVAIFLLAAMILLSIGSVMIFPVQAKFCNPIPRTFKMAYMVALFQFPKTILIWIVTLIPLLMMYKFLGILPLILCVSFSVPGFVAAKLYNKTFQKLEDQFYKEHGVEDLSAEDEHIFSDVVDQGEP